jgi:4-amino-4-deoxy-L-arabinose transferase-like glycosyltransferase
VVFHQQGADAPHLTHSVPQPILITVRAEERAPRWCRVHGLGGVVLLWLVALGALGAAVVSYQRSGRSLRRVVIILLLMLPVWLFFVANLILTHRLASGLPIIVIAVALLVYGTGAQGRPRRRSVGPVPATYVWSSFLLFGGLAIAVGLETRWGVLLSTTALVMALVGAVGTSAGRPRR